MRILIIKLGSLGDIIHTLPAAALLRRSFPEACISWVADSRSSAILKTCPAIDQLIELDTRAWNSAPLQRRTMKDLLSRLSELKGDTITAAAQERRTAAGSGQRELPGGPADIAIDFQGLIKSGVIALASRARTRVGCETSDLREKASRVFLTEQAATAHEPHIIGKNIALARAVATRYANGSTQPEPSASASFYDFPICLTDRDEGYAKELAETVGVDFAILNPGSAWQTKLWAPDRYAELSDWLGAEYGIRSLVTYGPGEEKLAMDVVSASKSSAARAVGPNLQQFVALARRAALFVGPDTGPLHLAAACGTPIVGLYGPTSPSRNGPFQSRDVTVARDLWCRSECHRRRCWHWECMDISVAAVKEAVLIRLAEPRA